MANSAEIGFERDIWKAADLLRGNMDTLNQHTLRKLVLL